MVYGVQCCGGGGWVWRDVGVHVPFEGGWWVSEPLTDKELGWFACGGPESPSDGRLLEIMGHPETPYWAKRAAAILWLRRNGLLHPLYKDV